MIERPQPNAATARDIAMIHLDGLRALAALLSVEEVASEFARLDRSEQVAIFGMLENTATAARAVLMQGAQAQRHVPIHRSENGVLDSVTKAESEVRHG
jgi:hypothetical protein